MGLLLSCTGRIGTDGAVLDAVDDLDTDTTSTMDVQEGEVSKPDIPTSCYLDEECPIYTNRVIECSNKDRCNRQCYMCSSFKREWISCVIWNSPNEVCVAKCLQCSN